MSFDTYVVRRPSRSRFVTVRGLRHHVLEWGDSRLASVDRPTLVMQHGWMDVAASFQFINDALTTERHVLAFDWRGFGLSDPITSGTYWLPDYTADLDAMLDAELFSPGSPAHPIDLLGHSMGGNVAMLYAGLRPERIRRLVNLEGFGMPRNTPEQAPARYQQWLDALKEPVEMRDYESLEAVAQRLCKTNPLLRADRAAWLAAQWSRPVEKAGATRYEILGDPVHKRGTPMLYQVDEALEIWKRIRAPLLWVEGDQTDVGRWWSTRYTKPEFHERLNVVEQAERHIVGPAGHMLHHDQPVALAALLERFLAA